jgi:hypothetical protein
MQNCGIMQSSDIIDVTGKQIRMRSAWCVIEINNIVFRAEILHISRGKFRILRDDRDNSYVGRIIDASDVLTCEL